MEFKNALIRVYKNYTYDSPELITDKFIPALEKEFSSEDYVLDYKGTKNLLKEHSLLPGMKRPKESGELLV